MDLNTVGKHDRAITIALVVSLFCIGITLTLRQAEGQMISETTARRRAIVVPFSMGGLWIDVAAAAKEGRRSTVVSRDGAVKRGRTLMLFASDTCSGSAGEMPRWEHLIRTTHWEPGDRVVLANIGSKSPSGLISAAKERHLEMEILEITNVPRWVATTGIGSTPATALIDSADRLDAVFGPIGPDAESLIAEYFGSDNEASLE